MNNSEKNIATYVLFGDEAVSIYKISIHHLLTATDISYNVGKYVTVKSFFAEKDKWKKYVEISYTDYMTLKADLHTRLAAKKKKRFFFSNLFNF